jgi:23S rRNA (cytidine1920-2'-O)/16S rRNA (cytidine1409-2'-O)-methyltransferase
MGGRRRVVRIEIVRLLARERPDLHDPSALVSAGRIVVDGRIVTNPRSLVRVDASVVVRPPHVLRGEAKLRAALARFRPAVAGRVALDVGAAAGGFTRVLLEAGARRVYAVDAGHGQLLGSLREDARVVCLESTNVARLDRHLVPDVVDLVTLDLSYLGVATAVGQLGDILLAPGAEIVALVKPMFELGLARPPDDRAILDAALARAAAGVERSGFAVLASMDSPVLGARGARELLLHARRR